MTAFPFRPVAKRIVLTGGPGAGKTAVLEVVRRELVEGIDILPESASIVFGGGFPRRIDDPSRRAAQRAIFHVQSELERMTLERAETAAMLCDRGTLDGLAYWPDTWDAFFDDVGTTLERELSRYDAVIHLRVPEATNGYHQSPLRIESAREAREIDARLLEVWASHPRRIVIDSDVDFLAKTQHALAAIRGELQR